MLRRLKKPIFGHYELETGEGVFLFPESQKVCFWRNVVLTRVALRCLKKKQFLDKFSSYHQVKYTTCLATRKKSKFLSDSHFRLKAFQKLIKKVFFDEQIVNYFKYLNPLF